LKEIKAGDKFGQWLVTEVEEHGNGEDLVLIEDTKGGFGEFWIPVCFLQTLSARHERFAANYHERFAEIVRRLAEWNDDDEPIRDVVKISIDAAALWKEYQEEGEANEAE